MYIYTHTHTHTHTHIYVLCMYRYIHIYIHTYSPLPLCTRGTLREYISYDILRCHKKYSPSKSKICSKFGQKFPRKKGKVLSALIILSGTCFDHATLWAFCSSIIHRLLLASAVMTCLNHMKENGFITADKARARGNI